MIRTDLVMEREKLEDNFTCEKESIGNLQITRLVSKEKNDSPFSNGTYVTVEVPTFTTDAELFDGKTETLAKEISKFLPYQGLVLVVGLGNNNITPDALGPKTIDHILATRHLSGELLSSIGLDKLRAVAAIAPGVLGQTGVETVEIIESLVTKLKPAAVIVIDALAARSLKRLGNTIQISDSGIEPGAGVNNKRKQISFSTLGVPVIAIGIPTVVDAMTLTADILNKDRDDLLNTVEHQCSGMMVTPQEIDIMVERAAKLVSLSINSALHPSYSCEELLSLVS